MGNSIGLFKKYIERIDRVYQLESLTSDLDGDQNLVKEGEHAGEFLVPIMSMDGLADYSRTDGYAPGTASLEYRAMTADYDRGRRFNIDAMDNKETAGIAFGNLCSEFLRTKVVAELDSYRLAKYAANAGTKIEETIDDGAAAIKALSTAKTQMDEDEVSPENRLLYITPTLRGLIDDMDTTKSRKALESFSKVIEVPQRRFYTAINLLDGRTEGEQTGGYTKAATGRDINFMVIHKTAVLQYPKHTVNKVISPDENQFSDAWLFFYRLYALAKVYSNKVKGIYVNYKEAETENQE